MDDLLHQLQMYSDDHPLIERAAIELARLRATVEELNGAISIQAAGVARLRAEVEKLRVIYEAAKLYEQWATRTGDYPHDYDGCLAHEAVLEAVRAALAPDGKGGE